MPLRVTDIERFVINVPFRSRVKPWNDLLVAQWGVIEITRVITNSTTIVGYGETLIHYTWERVSDEAVARVLGTNPAEHLSDDSLGAGLQMALYDVVGKALEVPMYRLLPERKVRDWCPIAWWNTKMPPELLAAEAQTALEEGYLAHKIKARPWFDVVEQVDAIGAVTPESYLIDIDWNGMLRTPAEAMPTLLELGDRSRVGLFESPIKQTDSIGFEYLRSRSPRPLAEHYRQELFPLWMRSDAIDVLVVFGAGVSGLVRQGQLAASFNKGFWLQVVGTGLTTAFTLHLGAVLSHATWPAVTAMNTLAADLLTEPIEIANGLARVPEAPGLGVTVDESALDRYRKDASELVPVGRSVLTFDLGDGRNRHYANMSQLWQDVRDHQNVPVHPRGARLRVHRDDGSDRFDAAHQAVMARPAWDFEFEDRDFLVSDGSDHKTV